MVSAEQIKKSIEQNREKVYKKDYNFFNIGYIDTLAQVSTKESCNCMKCVANLERLEELSLTYPDLIANGEAGKRKLEDDMDDITKHLSDNHGYKRKGWYKSLFSLYGMLTGCLIGGLVAWLVAPIGSGKTIFVIVAGVFMLGGYCCGLYLDSQIERKNKIL